MPPFIWILLAVISWIVAVFVFMHVTKEKLGARSDLLGIGMSNMVVGFLWHEIMEMEILDNIRWISEIPKFARILSLSLMILGVSGIIMMVIDIARAINEKEKR